MPPEQPYIVVCERYRSHPMPYGMAVELAADLNTKKPPAWISDDSWCQLEHTVEPAPPSVHSQRSATPPESDSQDPRARNTSTDVDV
jgi:hypothetical protein